MSRKTQFAQNYSLPSKLRFGNEEDGVCVSYSLVDPTVALAKGTVVKLSPTGAVEPITAATDIPLGYVVVPNNTDDCNQAENSPYKEVTICEYAKDHVFCNATAAITAGSLVAVSGYDPVTGFNQVATATSGDVVFGIALAPTTGAGETVEVAILNSFYQVP